MSYLHCHKCGWSQDDFYHKGYNPAESLMDWNDVLFGNERHKLDKRFTTDSNFIKENGDITYREVIARDFEKFAKRIRNMKWTSYDDFKKDYDEGIAKCPKCGSSKDFDID